MTRATPGVPDLSPASDLGELKGIGPARAANLAAAGVHRVGDLLEQIPLRYEDRRQLLDLSAIEAPGSYVLRGRLESMQRVRVRRRNLTLVRGRLVDPTGEISVLWFNRPYLLNQIEEGVEYSLYGPVRSRGSSWELVNPALEKVNGRQGTGCIVPIYPAIAGLSGPMIRRLVHQALEQQVLTGVEDTLPPHLRQQYSLPSLAHALERLHRPGPRDDVEALNARSTPAHARLSYGEFLELQLELRFLRQLETRRSKSQSYELSPALREILLEILPFRLTGAQRQVLKEITRDLADPYPMLRLLQGDVGSGKTIVAVLALVIAMENGLQGAFMAPTELLAEQHYQNLTRLLRERYRIGLLTRSVDDRERIKDAAAAGELQLVIGTHALIQGDVEFSRLGLAVVDEQHRFGVSQRKMLQAKGGQPDLLVMTATPIPRSLALTVYGDLSLSVIDELPPGRRPVETSVVPAKSRRALYRRLKEELQSGAQAYVVFPLIEESDQLTAESIEQRGEELRQYLAGVETAVLHGRIRADERESIMRRFRSGELSCLISTTVIEVGVDVANASLMVIESGERFGLSQLHQLRGRVGRGRRQSRCVVVHGPLSDDARRRLEVFGRTHDGFEIAEADLEIRGPGDLLGTRQSGVPLFRLADIIRDRKWLERARVDAWELAVGQPEHGAESGFLARIRERAQNRYETFAGG